MNGFLKAVFHFRRIVAKRTVIHCFVSTQAELMIWTQKNTRHFATIRLKWKAALILLSSTSQLTLFLTKDHFVPIFFSAGGVNALADVLFGTKTEYIMRRLIYYTKIYVRPCNYSKTYLSIIALFGFNAIVNQS